HTVAIGEVIFSVGQLQAALHQVGGIVIGVVETGRNPQSEKIRGVKICIVKRVYIRSQALPQGLRQFVLVANGGNRFEVWTKRVKAFRFDGGLVHEGVVEVGNFATV